MTHSDAVTGLRALEAVVDRYKQHHDRRYQTAVDEQMGRVFRGKQLAKRFQPCAKKWRKSSWWKAL